MSTRSALFLVSWMSLAVLPSCSEDDSGNPSDTDTYTDTDTDTDTDPDCTPGAQSDHAGISMAQICSGRFSMGSPDAEVGRTRYETAHEVRLTGSFYLGVYEVTQAQFEEQMGYASNNSRECAQCSAEGITWHQAAAFANAVSTSLGLEPCYSCTGAGTTVACSLNSAFSTPYACEGYRLPTEGEWEYAARGGSTSAFSNGGNLLSGDEYDCGDTLALDNGAYLNDIAWYCGHPEQTEEVGGKAPNPLGLYDVHGNASEWCHDAWDFSDYTGNATDPVGTLGTARVLRGGTWNDGPLDVRSAKRFGHDSNFAFPSIGFRLAKSK